MNKPLLITTVFTLIYTAGALVLYAITLNELALFYLFLPAFILGDYIFHIWVYKKYWKAKTKKSESEWMKYRIKMAWLEGIILGLIFIVTLVPLILSGN